jgi:hypothetical protein
MRCPSTSHHATRGVPVSAARIARGGSGTTQTIHDTAPTTGGGSSARSRAGNGALRGGGRSPGAFRPRACVGRHRRGRCGRCPSTKLFAQPLRFEPFLIGFPLAASDTVAVGLRRFHLFTRGFADLSKGFVRCSEDNHNTGEDGYTGLHSDGSVRAGQWGGPDVCCISKWLSGERARFDTRSSRHRNRFRVLRAAATRWLSVRLLAKDRRSPLKNEPALRAPANGARE